MPAAVPAIPPKPKIAAIIAITKNVNAHPNMMNRTTRRLVVSRRFVPTSSHIDAAKAHDSEFEVLDHWSCLGVVTYYSSIAYLASLMDQDENVIATHGNRTLFPGAG